MPSPYFFPWRRSSLRLKAGVGTILVMAVNQLEVVVTNQDRAARHTLQVVVTNQGREVKHTLEVVVTNHGRVVRQQEETVIVARQMLTMKMAICRGRWKRKIHMVIVVIPMIPMIRIEKRMKRMR
jgi:hypothetical protein